MKIKRIMIIGSAGSGKSTLSQRLGKFYDLPIIHLDRHYWLANWTPRSNEEWDLMVEQFATSDKWIIDGNYSRTMDARLRRADLVIYLDMPRWLCMYRIVKRRIMYHKKSRPDMNEGCEEKLDYEFIKWVWNYRKRSRVVTLQQLQAVSDKIEVIILKSQRDVKQFLAEHSSREKQHIKRIGDHR